MRGGLSTQRLIPPLDGLDKCLVEIHEHRFDRLQAHVGRNLDFNLHSRVCQAWKNHCGCRGYLPTVLSQNRPALLKFSAVRYDVSFTNDVAKS